MTIKTRPVSLAWINRRDLCSRDKLLGLIVRSPIDRDARGPLGRYRILERNLRNPSREIAQQDLYAQVNRDYENHWRRGGRKDKFSVPKFFLYGPGMTDRERLGLVLFWTFREKLDGKYAPQGWYARALFMRRLCGQKTAGWRAPLKRLKKRGWISFAEVENPEKPGLSWIVWRMRRPLLGLVESFGQECCGEPTKVEPPVEHLTPTPTGTPDDPHPDTPQPPPEHPEPPPGQQDLRLRETCRLDEDPKAPPQDLRGGGEGVPRDDSQKSVPLTDHPVGSPGPEAEQDLLSSQEALYRLAAWIRQVAEFNGERYDALRPPPPTSHIEEWVASAVDSDRLKALRDQVVLASTQERLASTGMYHAKKIIEGLPDWIDDALSEVSFNRSEAARMQVARERHAAAGRLVLEDRGWTTLEALLRIEDGEYEPNFLKYMDGAPLSYWPSYDPAVVAAHAVIREVLGYESSNWHESKVSEVVRREAKALIAAGTEEITAFKRAADAIEQRRLREAAEEQREREAAEAARRKQEAEDKVYRRALSPAELQARYAMRKAQGEGGA